MSHFKLLDQLSNYLLISVEYLYCNEQKLLLPSGLELMSENPESGALSLSSAVRHIDFNLSRRI